MVKSNSGLTHTLCKPGDTRGAEPGKDLAHPHLSWGRRAQAVSHSVVAVEQMSQSQRMATGYV